MTPCATECDIIVDEEFRDLIPPLMDEERLGLEEKLLREGCIAPLIVWAETRILLDGHNRKEICDRYGIDYTTRELSLADRDEAKRWIIEHQFGRRNLTPYQRAELALELKPLVAAEARQRQHEAGRYGSEGGRGNSKTLPKKSWEGNVEEREQRESRRRNESSVKLARVAGVSHDTIGKADYIAAHADEATKARLRRGKATIHAEYKRLRKAERKAQRARRKAARPPCDGDRYRLVVTDIADAAGHAEAESVDWIITDPPYPKQYLDLYDHLAAFARHALKPGGSLVAMIGQSYLPEILEKLTGTLTYHWTLAYLTPGGQATQLWARQVNTFWKPLLWLTKGKYDGEWVGDVCRSEVNHNDKRFHHWGQSESGMADIVDRLTEPGDVIADPFLGAGTTGVAAIALGRRFIGFDVDEDCVATAAERLAAATKEVADGGA